MLLCGSNDFLWVISEILELEETKSAINSGEFLTRVQLLRIGGHSRKWMVLSDSGTLERKMAEAVVVEINKDSKLFRAQLN